MSADPLPGSRSTVLGPALVGATGGAAGGLVWIVPPWLGFASGVRLAEFAGTLIIVFAVTLALKAAVRVRVALSLPGMIGCVVAATAAASLVLAALLELLYARLAPTLLATRYQAYLTSAARAGRPDALVTRELSRLASMRSHYLDPLACALDEAATVAFCALLLGVFFAWQRRNRAQVTLPSGPGVST